MIKYILFFSTELKDQNHLGNLNSNSQMIACKSIATDRMTTFHVQKKKEGGSGLPNWNDFKAPWISSCGSQKDHTTTLVVHVRAMPRGNITNSLSKPKDQWGERLIQFLILLTQTPHDDRGKWTDIARWEQIKQRSQTPERLERERERKMAASLQAAATLMQPAKVGAMSGRSSLQLKPSYQVSKAFGLEQTGSRLTCSLQADLRDLAHKCADATKIAGFALATSALVVAVCIPPSVTLVWVFRTQLSLSLYSVLSVNVFFLHLLNLI